MATKDNEREPALPPPDDAEASEDGYYEGRARRARLEREAREAAKAGKDPKDPGKAPEKKSQYDQFIEDHWVGWLRPVLGLLILGGGAAAYKLKMLDENFVGLLLSVGLVVLFIYSTVVPVFDSLQKGAAKALLGVATLLWVFSSGYPTLWRSSTRPHQGEARLTEAEKTAKVTIDKTRGGQGPFLMAVTGHIKPTGQETTVNYEIAVKSGATEEKFEGKLEYSTHQTQGRRGRSQWSEVRNQEEFRLPDSLNGTELQVSVDSVDSNLEDGLQVRFYPLPLNPWIFWGVGILVILIMMGFEARVGDAQNKTHLTMAAACTLIFAARYYYQAIPGRLVNPAIEAVFLAAVAGGIGGTLLGWIVRRVSGRAALNKKGDKYEKLADKTPEKAGDKSE